MTKIRTIPLDRIASTSGQIEFLRAEMANVVGRFIPFAQVSYARAGIEQPRGVRLDLDKLAALDRFDDPEEDQALEQALPQIIERIGTAIRRERRAAIKTRYSS